MAVDPSVLPGLALLLAELVALAAAGFVISRVVLRQADDSQALAQGMVIGPALWGLAASFLLFLVPGRGGALVTWIVVLALTTVLAWRTSRPLALRQGAAMAFAGSAVLVFGVMLAARQWLRIPDDDIHLGISSNVQAGGWPPVAPWTPDQQLFYHYGADILIGLLDPPGGPNLAFTTEVFGAYIWTGFALLLATAVLKRSGWIGICVLTPLVLSTGAWTLIGFFIPPPDIVKIPVLGGVPAAGLRASLADLYWPEVSLQWRTEFEASPPNIWKPPFVMAYALTLVVIGWAGSQRRRTWPRVLTIAALVAFLGLLVEEIALTVLGLWFGLEALRLVSSHRIVVPIKNLLPSRRSRAVTSAAADLSRGDAKTARRLDRLPDTSDGRVAHLLNWRTLLLGAAGPVVAAVLLAIGGGFFTAALSGEVGGASLGLIDDPGSRLPFGSLFREMAGGVGILGLGVVPVGAIALLVGWKDRRVVALVTGASVFMVAALVVQHRASQFDVTRMDGHARNFALLALLFALSVGLSALRPRIRYAACAVILVLVTWPTVAAPARMLAIETAHGVELSNADFDGAERDPRFASDAHYAGMGRFAIQRELSEPVVAYIRSQTAVDARVLSPNPQAMSIATGRPNASGFAGFRHLVWKRGPDYLDAIRYLEPAAVRRLGYSYAHIPDALRESLPLHANQWLDDPHLFEPLVRGDDDELFRIQPAFFLLEPMPPVGSFEALRQALPASTSVFLGDGFGEPMAALRAASTLDHTRLVGQVKHSHIYLLSNVPTTPPDADLPDVVLVRTELENYAIRIPELDLIWQGDGFSAYATRPGIAATIDAAPAAPDFSVRLSDVHKSATHVRFTAEFTDFAPEKWNGQDWLVVPVVDSLWEPLTELKIIGSVPTASMWFGGSVAPGIQTATLAYEFDASAARLALRDPDGRFADVPSSEGTLEPGTWMLLVRLRHDYLQAALIPVMTFEVSESGAVTYKAHAGVRYAYVNACPDRIKHTDSCRRLAGDSGSPTDRTNGQVSSLPG